MQRTLSLLAALAPALASCVSNHSEIGSPFGKVGIVVAESETAEGAPVRWRLYPGIAGAPRLDRTEQVKTLTTRVGIAASPVTSERAQAVGVEPFVGVWVDKVEETSPAAKVGIVPGDIVLRVAGQDVTSVEQFEHLVSTRGVPGEELAFEVRVYRQRGEPLDGRPSAKVVIVPEAREITESSTESVSLETSRGVQKYTGAQFAVVPTGPAREVFGEERDVVVVAGVVKGSPAYYAGLRTGDRVVECDGQPVSSLRVVREAVVRRMDEDWQRFDLVDVVVEGSSDAPIELDVTGELGAHRASVDLSDEIDDVDRFYIPIVTSYRSDVDSARLSFLDFIFQFGFNYRSNTYDSSTREPVDTWKLSLFPLGMFEFEKGVHTNEYTFFWLIDFETRR
jgi:hypothetical protein